MHRPSPICKSSHVCSRKVERLASLLKREKDMGQQRRGKDHGARPRARDSPAPLLDLVHRLEIEKSERMIEKVRRRESEQDQSRSRGEASESNRRAAGRAYRTKPKNNECDDRDVRPVLTADP